MKWITSLSKNQNWRLENCTSPYHSNELISTIGKYIGRWLRSAIGKCIGTKRPFKSWNANLYMRENTNLDKIHACERDRASIEPRTSKSRPLRAAFKIMQNCTNWNASKWTIGKYQMSSAGKNNIGGAVVNTFAWIYYKSRTRHKKQEFRYNTEFHWRYSNKYR